MLAKYFFILIFAFSQVLLAQTKDLEERIKKIQAYEKVLEAEEKKLNQLMTEVGAYSSSKMIPSEQTQLDQVKLRLKEVGQELDWTRGTLSLSHLDKKIDEIKKYEAQIDQYESKKKSLRMVENASGHSKRLDAYLDKIKEGKYNLATIILQSLDREERGIAEEYERNHLDVLRDQNLPEDLKKDIAEKRRQIIDSLKPVEERIEECKLATPLIDQQSIAFQKIKADHSLDQVKLSFYNSNLGYFDCKEQASYIIPNHLPGVLLLKNNQKLSTAIRLDSSSSDGYQVMDVRGTFNEKRMLCRLDPVCADLLKKSEEFYKREEFFPEIKNDLVTSTIDDIYQNLHGNVKNPLMIFQDMNKLGFYSVTELADMVKPVWDYAKTLQDGVGPKEHLILLSAKIDELQKKMLEDVAKRAKSSTDKQKKIDSENVVKFVFSSQLKPGLETLLKSSYIDYPIQDKAYERCSKPEEKRVDFCQASQAWRERLKLFDSYTEIKNLNTTNCKEGIFRLPKKSIDENNQCAPESTVDHLLEDMNKIKEKMN